MENKGKDKYCTDSGNSAVSNHTSDVCDLNLIENTQRFSIAYYNPMNTTPETMFL